MKKMNILDWIALILVIVGGLNWGLVGAFEFDLVAEIFGAGSTGANVVYIIVGVAALYMLVMAFAKSGSAKQGQMPQGQVGA